MKSMKDGLGEAAAELTHPKTTACVIQSQLMTSVQKVIKSPYWRIITFSF